VIEADGGSRGNPGPAAYGAVLRDADTGEVIDERAECIGVATNNVAEYRGLIAGLEMYVEHTPDADLEVRMDSKLVVEQMSGRWKIKHPDMRPLATAANRLAPFGTRFTWVPREQNKHADRLLNEALDEQAGKPARTPSRPATTRGGPAGLDRVSAISLFVEDVKRAKQFYQGVFGAPVVFEDDVSAAVRFQNLVVNLLQASEAAVLVAPNPVAGPESGSRFQLSIWVDDVDAVCAELQKRGVPLLSGPVDRDWGMRVATFTDPAGHSWEIAQSLED
jgi:ribonuclease HI/catechol 2,3-dioxygenase-like lactoylglutathione lyase family enzyme